MKKISKKDTYDVFELLVIIVFIAVVICLLPLVIIGIGIYLLFEMASKD